MAVAIAAAIMFTTTLLENDQMRPAGLLFDFANNSGTSNQGSADLHICTAADHQYLVEMNVIARNTFELFDQNFIVCGNAILLAACLNDCVHVFSLLFRALWRPFLTH